MEQQKQISFNISPEVAKGNYSNLAIIGHSATEFVIDFAAILPGQPNANVQTRVILAPEHAKRLLAALQDNVQKYESTFGQIKMANAGAPTIPMAFGGEA